MAGSGSLFIVSGPSGAGKSALSRTALQTIPGLKFSISYTTRPPRGSECDGVEYHFVDRATFETLVQRGDLLEWAEVYGNCYGTSRQVLDDALGKGDDMLLDVDVQGARTIRSRRPKAITVFVLPPSYQVLRDRLESRKEDKKYVIEQRLKIARKEIDTYSDYDYLIINDKLEKSVEELRAIIIGSRCRMAARAGAAESIVATFGGVDAEDP
jgi:guanylate kinase